MDAPSPVASCRCQGSSWWCFGNQIYTPTAKKGRLVNYSIWYCNIGGGGGGPKYYNAMGGGGGGADHNRNVSEIPWWRSLKKCVTELYVKVNAYFTVHVLTRIKSASSLARVFLCLASVLAFKNGLIQKACVLGRLIPPMIKKSSSPSSSITKLIAKPIILYVAMLLMSNSNFLFLDMVKA